MKFKTRLATTICAMLGLSGTILSASAADAVKFDFSDEAVGSEPKSFLSMVGVWRVSPKPTTRFWQLMAGNGKRDRQPQGWPTRRGHSTANAMRNFSIACRPMRISRTQLQRTLPIFAKAKFQSASRAYRVNRPRCRHSFQSQGERRLPDDSSKPARKQSCSVEIRKRQAVIS